MRVIYANALKAMAICAKMGNLYGLTLYCIVTCAFSLTLYRYFSGISKNSPKPRIQAFLARGF